MSQAIKTKKWKKDKKTLNPFFIKKRLGTAKKIEGEVNIATRKDKEACLEKTRKELSVIKQTADLIIKVKKLG